MRCPWGGGIHAPEHHSESSEALFAHTPGLRMVIPSSPSRAYGLLLAAIRDPDPVIFFEPTRLYRLFKQNVEDEARAQDEKERIAKEVAAKEAEAVAPAHEEKKDPAKV